MLSAPASPRLIALGALLAAGLGSGIAAWAAAPPMDAGVDAGVECGTPYEHDSGDDGGEHGSPENTAYSLDDFDSVQNCATCHPDHYDEWHGSIHAYSASNPVMWQGSEEIGETTDSPLVCIGCHAPVATLGRTLTTTPVVRNKAQLPRLPGAACPA